MSGKEAIQQTPIPLIAFPKKNQLFLRVSNVNVEKKDTIFSFKFTSFRRKNDH